MLWSLEKNFGFGTIILMMSQASVISYIVTSFSYDWIKTEFY